MAAKILWGSLALTPITLAAHYVFDINETALFVLAAAALVPLAWLVGEATEHVAEHTGPGVGGFVNASFGNAPELIIALFAVADGLPDVVRGSITGSIVSNLLLVLGAAMIAGGRGKIDRRSTAVQLAILLVAVGLCLIPSIPGWNGTLNTHELYVLTIPVAACLLALYVVTTFISLRRHTAEHSAPPAHDAWRMRTGLLVLAGATVATALISELLVHSLDAFGEALGLSQFFVAAVIVAIVGNAAEHGGAIVVAQRGHMRLASEIAVSSSAQVMVFVAPAIALLSVLVGPGLPLAFRPVELATITVATIAVGVVSVKGLSSRGRGSGLIVLYMLIVVVYFLAGDG